MECPYCKHEIPDWEIEQEWCESAGPDLMETVCPECEREFRVRSHQSVDFYLAENWQLTCGCGKSCPDATGLCDECFEG